MKILAIIFFGLCFRAFCLVVKVQSMSNEERMKYGHGPKGQGK